MGSTDTPWLRSNAYLNQPWGLGADRDGIWVANALGRNLVRFGIGPVEELGRAKVAGASIFTIGLGQDLDAGLLTDLASRPDWYLPAPDTSDLAAIYARIVVEIPCKPMWPSRLPRHKPV